jgi:hypothetical protein
MRKEKEKGPDCLASSPTPDYITKSGLDIIPADVYFETR